MAKPKSTTSGSQPPSKASRSQPAAVKYYLVAYNVLSTIGWGYILALLLTHILNLDGHAGLLEASVGSASSKFAKFMPFLSSANPLYIESQLPKPLQPIFRRFTTAYLRIGPATAFVQSCATLEIIHVMLGWVRSPLPTTIIQVGSRLYAIWGVTEQFPEVCSNPLYTTMVFAWSVTEVVRYSFYACNLLGVEPYPLLYLRYTAFYVLYPMGASSEAFLNYATLPSSSPVPSWRSWTQGMWKPTDYIRAALFLIWWPGLYVMYTYMMTQRKKVLGSGKVPKAKTT